VPESCYRAATNVDNLIFLFNTKETNTMNENEMLNPTAVETNEAAVAAAPGENVNAAPVSEPQEAKEATEAAPADEGVDEEVNEVPRATRRFNDDDLAIGAFIDDGNDMLHVDMPEDRRARDLAEMRRCVADNKHGPRRFLQGKVFGVRPVQNGSAVVEVSRGTLRVMIPAEDFFYFSLMKGIEENDATTRQRRYLRKAKLMNGAIINFCPYMEAKSEDGEVVFAGSRQDAMQLQRNRHFFGRNADVQNGSRAIASILSSGPDYVIAEALGVETSIGAGALSAYEYIDDVSKKFHVGEGIPVVIEDLNVDNENGTVSLRMNRAILERRANPAMNIHSLARNGAYGATVTSVQDNYYRLIVDVGNIQARVARTASDELLTRGDRVTLLVYGYDDKRNYVWGACHKA
jgi:hypothetical protein